MGGPPGQVPPQYPESWGGTEGKDSIVPPASSGHNPARALRYLYTVCSDREAIHATLPSLTRGESRPPECKRTQAVRRLCLPPPQRIYPARI